MTTDRYEAHNLSLSLSLAQLTSQNHCSKILLLVLLRPLRVRHRSLVAAVTITRLSNITAFYFSTKSARHPFQNTISKIDVF